jgi:hypothetical protein
MMQSWGSMATLLPMGGDRLWGNTRKILSKTDAPNPTNPNIHPKYQADRPRNFRFEKLPAQPMFTLRHALTNGSDAKLTPEQSLAWFQSVVSVNETNIAQAMSRLTYQAPKYPSAQPKRSEWFNPLLSPLPRVNKESSFSVHCLYGVGIHTETAYHIRQSDEEHHAETGWAFNMKKYRPPHHVYGVDFADG